MINRDNMYDQEKEGGSGNGFEMSTHNSDNSIGVKEDPSVKNLQNILFPITPRKSYSAENYLSSNFLKKIQLRENEGENEEPELEGRSSSSYSFIKNRDSKELFTKDISPMDCIDQPPRFPTECQVLDERVKHISYKPCPPEPYYVPTGNEFQPTPIGEESGIVVYQYCPISAVNYFSRSRIGGSEYLLPTCPSPEVDSLLFESRFESGNLAKAIKITPNYYELYLRSDMYTNRHMQWFYFRMTRMKKNYLYRFSIVNMTKSDNLYSEGMRPLIYSERDARLHSIGWRRCGSNITYFPNEKDATEESTDQIQYYTLTFTLEFPHDDDVVYLAHSYPYTYSDLQDYLLDMVSHPVKSTYTTLRLLCKSLAGNNVYYVTVTSPPNQENNGSTSNIKKKKAIVITARVHPGETPASWMMHGFLDYLTSDTAPAKELRDNFIFKLVPMLNPDGVIVGNNRCSLTGKDLNRQYKTVIRETYPSIWYTKLMIRRLIEDCGVAMYCDLHAHSKQHNIFIFGCENKRLIDRKLYEQIFPLMLHKNASEKFSFENCKFKIQKCKEGTGRVVMWMMGIENSFTMEASFGGATLGSRKDTHFNTMDYEQMGKTFCQTLLDYYDEDPRKERLKMKIINRLTKEGSNANEPTNIRLSDFSSDGSDTSSSDGDYERPRIMPLVTPAPPTTPTKLKKNIKLSKPPLKTKSPSRKPLEVCKANLLFDINEGETSDDSTQTESGSEKEKKKKKKKKKRKKRIDRKSGAMDFINGGFQIGRDYAVIDIMPDVKYVKSNKKETQPKFILDQTNHVRQNNHQRLLEVQQKLLSLKNKLWFGIGDVDLHRPLSWGPAANNSKSPVKQSKNSEKRISIRRQQKKNNKDEIKERQNKRPKEAMKRQTTVELHPLIKGNGTVVKLRKTKSLSENVKRDTKLIRQSTLKLLNIETSKKDETEPKSGKIKHKKTKPKTAKTTNQSSFNYID